MRKKVIIIFILFIFCLCSFNIVYADDCGVEHSPLFEKLNNSGTTVDGVFDAWLGKNEADLLEDLGKIDFAINDEAYSNWNEWGWVRPMKQIYEYITGSTSYYDIAKENNKYVLGATMLAVQKLQSMSEFENTFGISDSSKSEIIDILNKIKEPNFNKKLRAAISYKKTVLNNEMWKDSSRFTTTNQVSAYEKLKEIENSVTTKGELNKYGVNIGDSEETKLNYTSDQLAAYLGLFGERLNPSTYSNSQELINKIKENVKSKEKTSDKELEEKIKNVDSQVDVQGRTLDNTKYEPPSRVGKTSSGINVDDTIDQADKFIDAGEKNPIDNWKLKILSSSVHGILLTAGVIVAIIIGLIIGIKFMVGSVEEKADVKKLLVPYLVGCVVVFGSLGIWAAIVEILGQL